MPEQKPDPSEGFKLLPLRDLLTGLEKIVRLPVAIGTLYFYLQALEASGNSALSDLYSQLSTLARAMFSP